VPRWVVLLALLALAGCGVVEPARTPPSYGHISGGGGA
jgi:predicted small lipoprotein YifL